MLDVIACSIQLSFVCQVHMHVQTCVADVFTTLMSAQRTLGAVVCMLARSLAIMAEAAKQGRKPRKIVFRRLTDVDLAAFTEPPGPPAADSVLVNDACVDKADGSERGGEDSEDDDDLDDTTMLRMASNPFAALSITSPHADDLACEGPAESLSSPVSSDERYYKPTFALFNCISMTDPQEVAQLVDIAAQHTEDPELLRRWAELKTAFVSAASSSREYDDIRLTSAELRELTRSAGYIGQWRYISKIDLGQLRKIFTPRNHSRGTPIGFMHIRGRLLDSLLSCDSISAASVEPLGEDGKPRPEFDRSDQSGYVHSYDRREAIVKMYRDMKVFAPRPRSRRGRHPDSQPLGGEPLPGTDIRLDELWTLHTLTRHIQRILQGGFPKPILGVSRTVHDMIFGDPLDYMYSRSYDY